MWILFVSVVLFGQKLPIGSVLMFHKSLLCLAVLYMGGI